jgi:peptidoglycan/LPS O-acetylase OafA/YrhL
MKLTYRPEIDGLRAIAVGAVILYHAQITIFGRQPFEGGFIGVDIFFVISGYLITSIILKELVTTGSFSFKHFYERRIRRILPALLFVMLVSLPFAWMYLLSSSFIDFSKSILYSLGFGSNFYFHYSGQIYGAESGLLKPFLHTWSLSVEEQFYILFPVVLLFIFKYFRKHLVTILVIGLIISLQMADWGSRNYPSGSFYFLHTRMWELLAGSILAYFEITLGHRSKNKTLNLILPSVGMFLIGHSILFFNDKMFHPSFYSLSPIIGVCLIIWFSNKDELITKILSTKLFVGIGLISYSLYLWHYPIFSFARIVEFAQGNLFKELLLGIVIIILSVFSYYFIERPSRNKKNRFKFLISLILISISILVIVNINIVQKNGYKDRLSEIFQKNLSEPRDLFKYSDGKKCHNRCKFNTSSNKKVYIIGDSHMGSLMFNLKDRVVKKNYQFITSTYGGCLFYPGFNKVDVKTMKIDELCNNAYFEKLKENLSKDKNSIIIFGGRLPAYLSNYHFDNQEGGIEGTEWSDKYVSIGRYENIQTSFQNEISELSKNNKIILVYPIPEVGWNVPNKLNSIFSKKPKNVNKKNLNINEYISTSYQVYQNRTKSSFELLNSIQGDNIYRVYPHTLFCDTNIKDRCVTHDDKNIFYADDDHPSSKGAEMINDLIMKEIEKIELIKKNVIPLFSKKIQRPSF